MSEVSNDHLVLISGTTGTGKTTSLHGLKDDEGIMYLNCESGKKVPFKNKFTQLVITDPMEIYQAFEEAEGMDHIHTIVIDTLTYLLDMFESLYVIDSPDGFGAWNQFQQYFKNLMQQYVAASSKNVIFLAHTFTQLNKTEMVMQTSVPVKGALNKNGIESYFSCVISTKKMPIKDLEGYSNDFLNITDKERRLGFKYVFQTDLTADTIHERIRGPMAMWDESETFIDNNIAYVLQRLREYYDE